MPLMPDGLYTGSALLSATDEALNAYLAGYANGLLFSGVLGASNECVAMVQACIAQRSSEDMVSMLRRYVVADRKRLNEFAATLTFNAVFGPCFRVEFLMEPQRKPRTAT